MLIFVFFARRYSIWHPDHVFHTGCRRLNIKANIDRKAARRYFTHLLLRRFRVQHNAPFVRKNAKKSLRDAKRNKFWTHWYHLFFVSAENDILNIVGYYVLM